MAVKFVIFDMDGLMLDTENLYCKVFFEVCKAHNLSATREQYLHTVGMADSVEIELYKGFFQNFDGEVLHKEVQTECRRRMREGNIPVKTGLFELFDFLTAHGIKKCVATSNYKEISEHVLQNAGILPHLDGGVYVDMVAHGKPAPDLFLRALADFSVMPDDALVLEDSENGVIAANAAGIRVIMVPDLIIPSEEITKKCFRVCKNLSEVATQIAADFR